jgi:hypothetical protein
MYKHPTAQKPKRCERPDSRKNDAQPLSYHQYRLPFMPGQMSERTYIPPLLYRL